MDELTDDAIYALGELYLKARQQQHLIAEMEERIAKLQEELTEQAEPLREAEA